MNSGVLELVIRQWHMVNLVIKSSSDSKGEKSSREGRAELVKRVRKPRYSAWLTSTVLKTCLCNGH